MNNRLSFIGFLIRQFPRGHVVASLGLALVLMLAILLPQHGDSSASAATSLPLTLPQSASGSAPAPVDEPLGPQWTELTVRSGDTLGKLLRDRGVPATTVHELVTSDPALKQLAALKVGETLALAFDNEQLLAVERRISRIERLRAEWRDGSWHADHEKREYQRQVRYAAGQIEDSLFVAGQQAGLTDRLIMELANIFAWDIDFILDIRRGDHFRLLYEELSLDGERVGDGNILMAEFWNQGRRVSAFRFETADGRIEYLDPKGNSMRREFLRSPVEFARVSSRFNLSRKHPVLNKIRAHRGVDYAAPTGTPIRAAGDGRVEFAGVKGGYGNVVILRHGQAYSTLYAHMHRFARGIRAGTRVRQGQTIGYVGMTGLATGPHLHYEFRVNGVHRNPLTVPLPKAHGIPEGERKAFLIQMNRLRSQIALYSDPTILALNEQP